MRSSAKKLKNEQYQYKNLFALISTSTKHASHCSTALVLQWSQAEYTPAANCQPKYPKTYFKCIHFFWTHCVRTIIYCSQRFKKKQSKEYVPIHILVANTSKLSMRQSSIQIWTIQKRITSKVRYTSAVWSNLSNHQQTYNAYQQKNQLIEGMNWRSPVGARGSRGVITWTRARAEDNDHPISLIRDPNTRELGVIQILVVLWLGVVGQNHIRYKSGNAGRHHLTVSGHRRVEMAMVEVLWVVGELLLGARDSVCSGGVGARLVFELLC